MWLLDTVVVPMWWWASVAFGFGVIIGSFLNVYIYRFHTGKSLNGKSHCLSCGKCLCWFDLFPLISYVVLRGKCRFCGCTIPNRYFLVELATGLLFSFTLFLTTDICLIFSYWWLLAVLLVIFVYDLYHFIIPDKLTLILTGLIFAQFGYEYFLQNLDLTFILNSLYAAAAGSLLFFILWWYSKGQWLGFGDVKLAFPLGLLVGPTLVFSFVVLAFWIGAGISLLILGYQKYSRGKARLHLSTQTLTMKSAVPFAPFMVVSSLVILFTHFNVLVLFSFI